MGEGKSPADCFQSAGLFLNHIYNITDCFALRAFAILKSFAFRHFVPSCS